MDLLVCKGVGELQRLPRRVLEMKPEDFGILSHHPYVWDYLVALMTSGDEKPEVAHLFGGTYWLTSNFFPKLVAEVPAHDLAESIREWKEMLGKYPFKHMADRGLFELYCAHIKSADAVITPSLYSARQLTKQLGIPSERFHVIPHGCYPPDKVLDPPATLMTFLSVGALGPDKGHIYLLKAWKLLGEPWDARLLLVGEGPMLQNEGFKKLLMELRNLDWMPRVPEVEPLYGECHAYVQPSVTEGFGIPALEAASFGRPVIVSETAGVSELFEHEVHGFVIPPRDPEKLAEAMRYLLEDPKACRQMGRRAAERAREYSWDRVRGLYREFYGRFEKR